MNFLFSYLPSHLLAIKELLNETNSSNLISDKNIFPLKVF